MILFTGCARSGTKYTAKLMQNLGLDIQHEKMGKDGISSWWFTPDSHLNSKFKFDKVFHQVRHPLQQIKSCYQLGDRSGVMWRFICQYASIDLKEPKLLRCAKYYYYWNLEAEKKAELTFKIEDIDKIFEELCKRIGIKPDNKILNNTPRNINRSLPKAHKLLTLKNIITQDKDKLLTWEELRNEIGDEWFEKVGMLALEYKYNT